jgi:RNA polymerase sigma-70 factor (ECF subfamily)
MARLNTMMRPKPPPDKPKIDWQAELAKHDRWLRTVVGSRVREPQAVDDVMQEVSLAVVRQSAPLADAEKVAPWLYRIAVTQSLLYRRKQGRRRKLAHAFADKTQPSEQSKEADPLSWLLADERRTMVRRAIARLASRDAEILLLKYSEDWSYRELAEHLGISQSALQTRLHRARQRLRDELAAFVAVEATPIP